MMNLENTMLKKPVTEGHAVHGCLDMSSPQKQKRVVVAVV
jgi:hypothetical protein